MKKVFGLMMVLALTALVSCGEAVVETPVDSTNVEVEAPTVEVVAPEAMPVVDETMVEETTMTETDAPATEVVEETVEVSAE